MSIGVLRLPATPKYIQKRDGRIEEFNTQKIADAIFAAAKSVGGENRRVAESLAAEVAELLAKTYDEGAVPLELVQDTVEKVLIEHGHAKTAKAYILYRQKRTNIREGRSELMASVADIVKETNRDNANVGNSPSAKMLQIAEEASKSFYLKRVIPEEFSLAHTDGDIYIHDLAWYGKTLTCLQIPLGRLLKEGFNNGHGYIRTPKSIKTAAALAAIILQSNQNDQHGGQSFAYFDRDLAPYVTEELNKRRERLTQLYADIADVTEPSVRERIEKNAMAEVERETFQAMESFIYNSNTMHSRAGAQVPFSSINLGTDTSWEGRLITRCFLEAYAKGLGRGEQPIFPNVGFKLKTGTNYNPDDPNYDLFQFACKVASKRLFPAFINEDASFNCLYGDEEVAYMGCRTRVIANINGPEVTTGRGNLSFTSLNLPRIGLLARGNWKRFYQLLDERIDLIVRQLLHRYNIQKNLRVRDLPFLFGQHLYMGSEGLGPDDKIEQAIKHGSLSMGFIGLAETLTCMTGRHHAQSKAAHKRGIEIVAHMRRRMDEATKENKLNFTLLATPAEGLSGKFVEKDVKRFGVIPGVTDKEWYTNSFHVPVECDISLFEKVRIEAAYHKYCNAGHISYVEIESSLENNPEAFMDIVRFMHDSDLGYYSLNFPVDYCDDCGFSGVITTETCPVCSKSNITRIRRITGYLSAVSNFGKSKKAELANRRVHLVGKPDFTA